MIRFINSQLSICRNISATGKEAWDLLTDTRKWPVWGPTVVNVESNDEVIKEGSRGRVQIPGGIWLPFTITSYKHGCYWDWKVASIKATGHRVEHLNNRTCRIIF